MLDLSSPLDLWSYKNARIALDQNTYSLEAIDCRMIYPNTQRITAEEGGRGFSPDKVSPLIEKRDELLAEREKIERRMVDALNCIEAFCSTLSTTQAEFVRLRYTTVVADPIETSSGTVGVHKRFMTMREIADKMCFCERNVRKISEQVIENFNIWAKQ